MGRNRRVSIEFATAALDRSLTASSAAPRSAFPSIVLKKSFWGDERKFLEPLMRFACGDMRGPHRFTQKRPRSFVSALRSIAVAVSAKKQLLRDFRRRSIFDFCNTIEVRADERRAPFDFRKTK